MNRLIRKSIFAAGAILVTAMMPSCGDDNDITVSPLPEKTYTGNTALLLGYDGAPMSGKYATFDQNGNTASITFGSTVSPSSLSKSLEGLPDIPGPGVLPGSPLLTLPVYLKTDGGFYTFDGEGETEFVSYSYAGKVNGERMEFDFSNVRLKDKRFAGTVWTPAPLEKNSDGITYKSLPLHIVWECSLPPLLEGFDGTVGDALTLLATAPVIPVYGNTAYMSAAQAVASTVRTLAFREDGNAVVTYLKKADGAAQFALAPICMIQYLPVSGTRMNVFVNPTDLMGQILINNSSHPDLPPNPFGKVAADSRGETTADTGLLGIAAVIAPLLSEGLPMDYVQDGNTLSLYLGTETLLPLVKEILVPLLKNPEIQSAIITRISSDPTLAGQLPIIEALLKAFPDLIGSTSRIEFGINLVQASAG